MKCDHSFEYIKDDRLAARIVVYQEWDRFKIINDSIFVICIEYRQMYHSVFRSMLRKMVRIEEKIIELYRQDSRIFSKMWNEIEDSPGNDSLTMRWSSQVTILGKVLKAKKLAVGKGNIYSKRFGAKIYKKHKLDDKCYLKWSKERNERKTKRLVQLKMIIIKLSTKQEKYEQNHIIRKKFMITAERT
jgi:hypothetical protein